MPCFEVLLTVWAQRVAKFHCKEVFPPTNTVGVSDMVQGIHVSKSNVGVLLALLLFGVNLMQIYFDTFGKISVLWKFLVELCFQSFLLFLDLGLFCFFD